MTTTETFEDPLGKVERRKLHVVLMLDRSRSMKDHRIESLNESVRTVLPLLKEASARNPQADVHVRQLEFSSGARWRTSWVPISEFGASWKFDPLDVEGITDLGAALDLLTAELDPAKLGSFNFPPVVVLVTDGRPTDDWESALRRFNDSPFGKRQNRTVRAAINVKDGDAEMLAKFTGNPEMVLEARNSAELTSFLKWATIELTKHASSAGSTIAQDGVHEEKPPAPPPQESASPDDQVF